MNEGLFYKDDKTGKKMAKEFWREGTSDKEIEFIKKKIEKIIEIKNLKPRFVKYGDLDQYDILLNRIVSDYEGEITFKAKQKQMVNKLNNLFDEMDELEEKIDELRENNNDDSKINDLRQKLTEKRDILAKLLNEKIWDESVADFN